MIVARTIGDLELPRHGVVGLVPTMGALHEGHLALLRAGRAESDVLVASLFVNPAQFGDAGDLAAYPRDFERDAEAFEVNGVDVLFAPSREAMYPPGFATWVEPEGVALGLEGDHRPGHFRGVATVCLKLFNIVRPELAWFGRKDAQQVAVLKQLVRDLNVPVEIRVVETIRDTDELAFSSRNEQLSADDRRRAGAIPRALATRDADAARAVLTEAAVDPDYVAVADLDGPTLAIAARIGSTRLIDNIQLDHGGPQ
jgi:pantoate--beta-alanine ligase